ncbi:hypothetical protein [Streptomyces sp. MS19]|uniref:hypothetical protein n=1 Tax=Streptomyces sp. MS19 TaxID=3385972 RepID=UPI0039A3110B
MTVFSAILRERGWTEFRDFQRAYEKAAAELFDATREPRYRNLSISERTYYRWCAGEVGVPRGAAAKILGHMFNMPAARLFEGPDGEAGVTTVAQAGPHDERQEVDAVSSAASESAAFMAAAEQTNIGPHTLEQLQSDIRRILLTYPNRPVEPTFQEVRSLRDQTFQLLEGRQPPERTRDLYLAAGVLCAVLANASFDMGRYDAAETQARTSYLCGELAGHNGLRAWIRGLQALMAYWEGDPARAVRFAELGEHFVPEEGTAHIRLVSIAARAHAQMGRTEAAEQAMRRADRYRETATPDDVTAGMMAFPMAKQLTHASTTKLWAADSQASIREAESLAQNALALFDAESPERRRLGELCLARLDIAQARLLRGDLEGAAEQIHIVLGISSQRRIESVARGTTRFARVLGQSQAANSPLSTGLRDAIALHHTARALPGTTS